MIAKAKSHSSSKISEALRSIGTIIGTSEISTVSVSSYTQPRTRFHRGHAPHRLTIHKSQLFDILWSLFDVEYQGPNVWLVSLS